MIIRMTSTNKKIWPPVIGYKLKNGLKLAKILPKTKRRYHEMIKGKMVTWEEMDGIFQ